MYYNEEGLMVAEGELIAYRGLFLIDKEGMVRHQLVNDLPLGRNVDEALRRVDALQFFEANGEVCPANWSKGKDGMQANHTATAEYLAQQK
jgi:peroxiredoxin (alkyl hydroperoxide reductase subunit C)